MKKIFYTLVFATLTACSMPGGASWGRLTYSNAKKKESTDLTIRERKEQKLNNLANENLILEPNAKSYTHEDLATASNSFSSNKVNAQILSTKSNSIEQKFKKLPNDSCDRIVFKNGNEKYGVVTEINNVTIKYKSCDNVDGPIYEIEKSEILFVQFKNGKKEVFTQEEPKKQIDPIQPPGENYRRNTPSENMILAGFILSLASYPLCIIFPPLPFLGLIFSWSGLVRGRRDSQLARNEKLAVAGIILTCFIFFAAMVIALVALTVF